MQDIRRSCQYLKTIVISSVKPTIISLLKYCLPATKSIFFLNSPLLYQISHSSIGSLDKAKPEFLLEIAVLLGRIREKSKYDKSLVYTPGCAHAVRWKRIRGQQKETQKGGPMSGKLWSEEHTACPWRSKETTARQLKPNKPVETHISWVCLESQQQTIQKHRKCY